MPANFCGHFLFLKIYLLFKYVKFKQYEKFFRQRVLF